MRTRVERLELADARKLCQIEEYVRREQFSQIVVPVDRMFDKYPALCTAVAGDRLVHNGNALPGALLREAALPGDRDKNREYREEHGENTEAAAADSAGEEQFRVYDSQCRFVGIFRKKGQMYAPVKMFYC